MNIAFFGASSQIARGLIKNFSRQENNKLYFFVRDKEPFAEWLKGSELDFDNSKIKTYNEFSRELDFDLLINCIGAGDPAKAANMSSSIVLITQKYDEQVLNYLSSHPNTKYIFLSSGAAYGDIFSSPPKKYTQTTLDTNSIKPEEMYAISKIKAELGHRDHSQFSIIDIRIFGYFDTEISIESRFFLTDALRSIIEKKTFITNKKNFTRDYIGADDLYQLITLLIAEPRLNLVVDAYSLAPIDKLSMLETLKRNFDFKYKFEDIMVGVNATGAKDNYYSKNYCAKNYGYQPSLSSEEIIVTVANSILLSHPKK